MLSFILGTFFITFYLTRLWYLLPSYRSDWWIVEYGICEFPRMHYYWLMKGIRSHNLMEVKSALEHFNQAYLCKPYDPKVLFDLATAYLMVGDLNNAEKFIDLCEKNYYDENEESMIKEVALFRENLAEARSLVDPKGMTRLDLSKIRIYR